LAVVDSGAQQDPSGHLGARRRGPPIAIETWQAPYDLSIDNIEFVAPPKTKTSCVPLAR